MKRLRFLTNSARETQVIAGALAEAAQGARNPFSGALVVTLSGELGAGKTTFAQGFARGFGIRKRTPSPTFILMRTYAVKKGAWKKFVHIDCYRLKKHDAARALPFDAILKDPSAAVLIEWPERLARALPKKRVAIALRHRGVRQRSVTVTFHG